ncbi:MAG: hypothetical protein R6X15_03250 [Pseudomonadota bacterium]
MSPYRMLFPAGNRSFPAMRWVNILLRTVHLIGVAGLAGAYLYEVAPEEWRPYLWLTLISGIGMIAVSLYANGVWLLQLRGQVILFKLLLLLFMLWWPVYKLELGLAVIVLSSVIAHAPGNLRYYSPWHRRRIDSIGAK